MFSTLVSLLAATAPQVGQGQAIAFGLGVGLGAVGAGIGIGRIGGSSAEATARQPEMAPRIFTVMILTAALVEGVALFALVIGFLIGYLK